MKPPLGSQLQFGDPLAQGLVGCWLMNEGAGNKVNDLSPNGRHGTNSGVVWGSGDRGPCVEFDGAAASISIPYVSISQCTYVVRWWQTDATVTKYPLSFMKTSIRLSDSAIRFITDDSAGTYLAAVATWTSGSWHTVAVTSNGDLASIFFDGRLVAGPTSKGALNTTNTSNYIGRRTTTYFDGKIDFASIYSRALSASEIAQLYIDPFRMFRRRRIELWTGATSPTIVTAGGIMTLNTGYWGGV